MDEELSRVTAEHSNLALLTKFRDLCNPLSWISISQRLITVGIPYDNIPTHRAMGAKLCSRNFIVRFRRKVPQWLNESLLHSQRECRGAFQKVQAYSSLITAVVLFRLPQVYISGHFPLINTVSDYSKRLNRALPVAAVPSGRAFAVPCLELTAIPQSWCSVQHHIYYSAEVVPRQVLIFQPAL